MYSVVDVAGLNSISAQVFDNAAAGIAGMAKAFQARSSAPEGSHAPLIGISMFGLTTPAADEARATLNELGYECLVFPRHRRRRQGHGEAGRVEPAGRSL